MPAFYRAHLPEFLAASESELTGRLSTAYAHSGFVDQKTSQTLAWMGDLFKLREQLEKVLEAEPSASTWSVLLEFPIPRKEKRIDVIILAGSEIVLLELKTSSTGDEAKRQAEDYALLLCFFHGPSNQRKIRSFIVSSVAKENLPTTQMFLPIQEAPAYWVPPVERVAWAQLGSRLLTITAIQSGTDIDPEHWDDGEYRPVPGIIDAALSLKSGLSIREIAHSRADRYDIDKLTDFISTCIADARAQQSCTICFVTGVPGSGKTLVGLNLAFSSLSKEDPIYFMSGTGPLVKVLQAALAEHHRKSEAVPAADARRHAKTLIENVHVFAKYYAEENTERAPSNHIIIFDEAQRAWDRQQNMSKFKRDYSEPEMLLSIMERHENWAVIIALVGGGQEINRGEAGLEEWGRALAAAKKPWKVFTSPEALEGGAAVAGSQLFHSAPEHGLTVSVQKQLHLDVSVRSLKADAYSAWVNQVVLGNAEAAKDLASEAPFAVLMTRSLQELRDFVKQNTLGASRCGLVASSGAARIRAEGLEADSSFHKEYPWHHWYLGPKTDVRSSHQLEVFATEFEIQGLELDWVGLIWGGDFIWSAKQQQWICRTFSHKAVSAWRAIKNEREQTYRRNAYRVLLTRARQGIVIYVPEGDSDDSTRKASDFAETAEFLQQCGVRSIVPAPKLQHFHPTTTNLFDLTHQ